MSHVQKIHMLRDELSFSQLVQGYWRMAEWNLSHQEILSFLKTHVDLGITTVDHAHIYGNPSCEELFGNALKLDPSFRKQIEIISKCGIIPASAGKIPHYDFCKDQILASVNLSLSRLGTDYLDVLLLHRPDFLMMADELAEVFVRLKTEGKVRHFGVSNFSVPQFSLLQSRLDFPLVTNQIEINPIHFEVLNSGVLEDLQQRKIHPMAWSCLGGGEIFQAKSEKIERLVHELHVIADELGAESIDQVIYAWVLKLPSKPIPVLGTREIHRIKKAIDSLQLSMSHEQWYRILAASRGHQVA